MRIISREEWGARPWNGQPYTTPLSSRTHFLVHYHGGQPRHDRGDANAKEIEGIHYANGWSGIGYNFIVGQDGEIREGRGWNLVGAHCPNYNRVGIGVYVAVGGNQQPTEEALRAVRWLYDEACRKTGKTLYKGWHGKYYPTACAGPKLISWVRNGMKVSNPAPDTGGSSTEKEDWFDMASLSDLEKVVEGAWSKAFKVPGEGNSKRTRNQMLNWAYTRAGKAQRDAQKALAVAREVAKKQGLTDKQLDEIEAKIDALAEEE